MSSAKVAVTSVLTTMNWAVFEGLVVTTEGAGSVMNSKV